MSINIRSTIGRVSGGEDLAMDEMEDVIGSMMEGSWSDDEIGLFLNALRLKSETVMEIAGAARAMRQHMTPIRTARTEFIDT
ncbi:MAG: anthranilate phosphoribosyltransferase, partial [Planctomycetota bacterium]